MSIMISCLYTRYFEYRAFMSYKFSKVNYTVIWYSILSNKLTFEDLYQDLAALKRQFTPKRADWKRYLQNAEFSHIYSVVAGTNLHNVLRHIRNTQKHTVTQTATHCNALQRTLQHTATHQIYAIVHADTETHCNTLQQTATRATHTATHLTYQIVL